MHATKLLAAIAALSSLGLVSADNKPQRKRLNTVRKNKNGRGNNNNGNVMNDEDVAFWTRLLQDRGKGTEIGSLPVVPRPTTGGGIRPPAPTPPVPRPTPPAPTPAVPNPTPKPTPRPPIPTPTPPSPTPPVPPPSPAFKCPDLDFCTAPDPTNPADECNAVGEPCENGNPGEFCCEDSCRKYCTAKQAP